MDIKIQALGFVIKPELEEFIKAKTEKLFRLYEKTLVCEVALKIEKSERGDSNLCDIRLVIPGNDLFAGAQGSTFEEAVMKSIEALERQIEKKKTKEENERREK